VDENIYQRAEKFLPWNLQHSVLNSTIFPYWSTEALYYFQDNTKEKVFLKVDYNTGKKEVLFPVKNLLEAISFQLHQQIDFSQLPLDKFSVQENPRCLEFSLHKKKWRYDVEKNICIQEVDEPNDCLISPNKNLSLGIKNHNLILTDMVSCDQIELTSDGKAYYDYAASPETNTRAVSQRLDGSIQRPVAIWSSDSNKIVTHKLDQRNVKELHILQNAPSESQRPVAHVYKMSFSGDEHLPLAELIVIDVTTKRITTLKTDPLLSPYLTPIEFKWVWWSEDSKKVYFIKESRASKEFVLFVADANTGEIKKLVTEKTNKTYVEPSQLFLWPRQILVLEETKEIVWLSERSGYSHLYLYDMENGSPKIITQGEWGVREVHFYDAKENWLYFTACGYDTNIDPYYKFLFRCHLDGSELECITEEKAHHTICFSPSMNCFLDTYSTINTAPVTVLKTMAGKTISHLETADIEGLSKLNWVPPQRFCVKARDGVNDIYGNLYFPSYYDKNKIYPIIDHIYPGPQVYRTQPYFNLYGLIFRSAWTAQALAELGFIVIHVDGLGTPGRSKEFHDATYRNMSDCGIEDHVVAIKQLASIYPINLEKVGITGFSGGGYAAVRAMLLYPDFYKVGVAAAGNHDLRCYPASYGEKYNSLDVSTYEYQSNSYLAEKLEGKLLLIHGEMDDNVHLCATMQLADAFIKHNKDFDMLIMPNQNHRSTFDHPYYIRRQWDYLVNYLLGEIPPKNKHLTSPIPLEFPQIIDW